jgi:CO/xanthine dehydrogenase FAD-binding subunit
MAWRSAPLRAGGPPFWHAAARIDISSGKITEAAVALKGPGGVVIRLDAVEYGLLSGLLADADEVLDAVRDAVDCSDDSDGSASAKSYIAGWLCADVVGRCLA